MQTNLAAYVYDRATLLTLRPDVLAGHDFSALNARYLNSYLLPPPIPEASRWRDLPVVPLAGVPASMYLGDEHGQPVRFRSSDGQDAGFMVDWLSPEEHAFLPLQEALGWVWQRQHWWMLLKSAAAALDAERGADAPSLAGLTEGDIVAAHQQTVTRAFEVSHMRQSVAGLWDAQVLRWIAAGFMPREMDHLAVRHFMSQAEQALAGGYQRQGKLSPLVQTDLVTAIEQVTPDKLRRTLQRMRQTRELSVYFRTYANRWVPGDGLGKAMETAPIVKQLARMQRPMLVTVPRDNLAQAVSALGLDNETINDTPVTYMTPGEQDDRLLGHASGVPHDGSGILGFDKDTGGVVVMRGTERPFTATWRGMVKRWPSYHALLKYATGLPEAERARVSVLPISTPVAKSRMLWASAWGKADDILVSKYEPAIMVDAARLPALEGMAFYLTGNPGERARVLASGFPVHQSERLWSGPVERLLVAATHGLSLNNAVSLVDPTKPWDLRDENITFETSMGQWFRTVGNVEVPVQLTGEDLRARVPIVTSKTIGRPKSGVAGVIWSKRYRGWATKVRGWDGSWYEGPVRADIDEAKLDLISIRNHIFATVPVEILQDPSLLQPVRQAPSNRAWIDFTEIKSVTPEQDGLDWDEYRRYAVMEHQLRLMLSQETGVSPENVDLEMVLDPSSGPTLMDQLAVAHARVHLKAGVK